MQREDRARERERELGPAADLRRPREEQHDERGEKQAARQTARGPARCSANRAKSAAAPTASCAPNRKNTANRGWVRLRRRYPGGWGR